MKDTGIEGRVCQHCHRVKDTLIKCKKCSHLVCLACFYIKDGLCVDCIVDKFNEEYKNQIENNEKIART